MGRHRSSRSLNKKELISISSSRVKNSLLNFSEYPIVGATTRVAISSPDLVTLTLENACAVIAAPHSHHTILDFRVTEGGGSDHAIACAIRVFDLAVGLHRNYPEFLGTLSPHIPTTIPSSIERGTGFGNVASRLWESNRLEILVSGASQRHLLHLAFSRGESAVETVVAHHHLHLAFGWGSEHQLLLLWVEFADNDVLTSIGKTVRSLDGENSLALRESSRNGHGAGTGFIFDLPEPFAVQLLLDLGSRRILLSRDRSREEHADQHRKQHVANLHGNLLKNV